MARDFEVIAHRGFHRDVRENTMEAFRRAAELGVDWIELDVWSTADGVLVIYHNPAVDSDAPWFMPEEERKHILVRDITYEEMLDACGEKGFQPPVLEDVLREMKGRVKVDIEIKMPGIEKMVLSAVRDTAMEDSVMFSSFYDVVLREFYRLEPDIPRGMILGFPVAALGHRLTEFWPYKRAEIVSASYIMPYYKLLLCPGYVWHAHRHGVRVWPWPIGTEKDMKKMVRYGVDGLITDIPDMALKYREGV